MESRSRKVCLGRHHSYRIDRLVGPRGNGSCIHSKEERLGPLIGWSLLGERSIWSFVPARLLS